MGTAQKKPDKQASELSKLRNELETMRRRMVEAEAAAKLNIRLAAAKDLDEIINVVREETERLLNWDAFYFSVRRPGTESFRFMTFIDTVDGEKKVFPRDEEVAGSLTVFWDIVNKKESKLINRTPGGEPPNLVRFGEVEKPSASLLYVPVVSSNETIGVISAQSYTHYRYGESELALLGHIANATVPSLVRTYIEEIFDERDILRDNEYFVDNQEQEFKKLLGSIALSKRYSGENKKRFSIILEAMRTGESITRQEIENKLSEEGLALPKNPSGFIRHRLHTAAMRHGFAIKSDGNAYRLIYEPRARGIVFFTTEAGDAEHLVNILRIIDASDRDTLEQNGIQLIEAGGITGESGDVFCILEANSPNHILTQLTEILQDSKRKSYSMSKKKYLTASEIIRRSETRLVVPGMSWRRRGNDTGDEND